MLKPFVYSSEELWDKTVKALEHGDFSLLDKLLAEAGVSVVELLDSNQAEKKYFEEALTWASFVGRTDKVAELLDRGVDPAAGIATGLAGFHWAANRGNLDTVNLLIERKAPLEQRNMYDGTVLGCTLWSAVYEHRDDHAEIVEALVRAGAVIEPWMKDWWESENVPSIQTKERVARAIS